MTHSNDDTRSWITNVVQSTPFIIRFGSYFDRLLHQTSHMFRLRLVQILLMQSYQKSEQVSSLNIPASNSSLLLYASYIKQQWNHSFYSVDARHGSRYHKKIIQLKIWTVCRFTVSRTSTTDLLSCIDDIYSLNK